jgi:hypothetical protein
MDQLTGFFWFVCMLIPLIYLQRFLHREIQAVFLILTRSAQFTMVMFQMIFLPGVFVHEASHFLMAKILRVPTGRFSILPKPLPNGRLQLGYVETAQADIVRDSLIGAAPLITGTICVAYIAFYRLEVRLLLDVFREGQLNLFWLGIRALPTVQDFYVWFYLVFAISSTMMPSASDRHAWLELIIAVGVLFSLALLIGAGPWLWDNLAPMLSNFLGSVAVIFGLSAIIHVVLLLPTALIHKLLAKVTGVDVV